MTVSEREKIICCCGEPVPEEALEPRFCVACGRPVAQRCPYEPAQTAVWLPLRARDGRPPGACSACGGLFHICRACGRLHRLDEHTCNTAGCPGPLEEPSAAFPTLQGPLDGTRTAPWRAKLEGKLPTLCAQDVGEMQQMAFRYGLLVGVAGAYLLAFAWEGGQWRRRMPLSLASTGSFRATSLILDAGYAFVLAADRALAVNLIGMSVEVNLPETSLLQTRCRRWWARVSDTGAGRSALLRLTDGETWSARDIALPCPASDVAEMAADERIYLATRSSGVLTVDPERGRCDSLTLPFHQWVRIAAGEGRVVALGYDASRQPVLCAADARQGVLGLHALGEGALGDFAWRGDDIFLARETGQISRLETFSLRALSQMPRGIALPSGQETQPGWLILAGEFGQMRLLICRRAGGVHSLYLVDPSTGALNGVGGALASLPLICLADSRLVIHSRGSDGTKLRTYEVQ